MPRAPPRLRPTRDGRITLSRRLPGVWAWPENGWNAGSVCGTNEAEQAAQRASQGDHGSALVEAAIVLPIIALLMFGIVEIGFLFRSATVVSTSSRNGARLASAQYGSAKTAAPQNTVMDNVRLTVERT